MNTISIVFGIVWAVWGGAYYALLFGSRDVALKKRCFPYILLGFNGSFLAFLFLIEIPMSAMIIVTPVVILLTYNEYITTRYCRWCGGTLTNMLTARFTADRCPWCKKSIDYVH